MEIRRLLCAVSLPLVLLAGCALQPSTDAPGLPYEQRIDVHLAVGVSMATTSVQIPADKRLVIEHVSFVAYVPAKSGQNVLVWLSTLAGGTGSTHAFASAVNVGVWHTDPSFERIVASQPIRTYHDGSNSLSVTVERSGLASAGQLTTWFMISGRLLPLPPS